MTRAQTLDECRSKHTRLWIWFSGAILFIGVGCWYTWSVVAACYTDVRESRGKIHERISGVEKTVEVKVDEIKKEVSTTKTSIGKIEVQLPFIREGIDRIEKAQADQQHVLHELERTRSGGE